MAAKSKKRLTRGKDIKLFGVCSGIASYLGVDSTVIRLSWIILTAFTGFFPGLIAYVIASLVIPEK